MPMFGADGRFHLKILRLCWCHRNAARCFFLVTPFCHLGWVRITVDLKSPIEIPTSIQNHDWVISHLCYTLSLALEVMHEILPSYASRCYHIDFLNPQSWGNPIWSPKTGLGNSTKTGIPSELPAKKKG